MESSTFRKFALGSLALTIAACAGPSESDLGPSEPDQLGQHSASLGRDDRYIVKFVDHGKRDQTLAGHGAKLELDLPSIGATAVRIPAQAVKALQANPNVEYIEPDELRQPLALTDEITPWGITAVQAREVAFTNDPSIKVCIIDSGIQKDHPDFTGVPVTGYSGVVNSAWDVDNCGHGTHVAGTIAALDDTTGVVGMAPGIGLHIVKVFGDDCKWAYASDLINALQNCRASGAKIVSMSLGGTASSRAEKAAFQSAYDAGVLSIAAAGNDASSVYNYPASYASVISVAAVDSTNQRAWFSNANSQVELAAPGVGVISTYPTNKVSVIVHAFDATIKELISVKPIEGTAATAAEGPLVDGGACAVPDPAWSGKVVACSASPSAEIIEGAGTSGALGVVFANTLTGPFSVVTSATIPAVNTAESELLLASSGFTVSLYADGVRLAKKNGTSMATPHVSGAAALIWSKNNTWTNAQIRQAMQVTAKDILIAGRDTGSGYGLVQPKAALELLTAPPAPAPECVAKGGSCTANGDCCSLSCSKKTKTCS